jgi:hypothetical protein
MKSKIYCIGVVAFGLLILAGCAGLIPPEAAAGMNGTPTRVKSTSDYPEHFVYRIDDHRYITIKGNSGCEGVIYYYDTRLGIRTAVAATGLTLGVGTFGGYYAIDSDYLAIPATVFSQTSGEFIYIYYSRDGGKTFDSFWAGADVSGRYSHEENVIIVKDNLLYLARNNRDAPGNLYMATLYDVSRQIVVNESRHAVLPDGRPIDPGLVPFSVKSPSGSSKWNCGSSNVRKSE